MNASRVIAENLGRLRGVEAVPRDEPERLAVALTERRERGESLVAIGKSRPRDPA